jgi:hypothetical protein
MVEKKFHTITNYPHLTDEITTDSDWDRLLVIPWDQFLTMHEGDGLEIVGTEGVWIGSIEHIGDAEMRENYIVVDLM